MPSLDLTGRHPGVQQIMRWFESDHLPPRLRAVAGRAAALAELMVRLLPDDPELVVGLRKLKEAKDCFVCAELSRTGDRVIPPDAEAVRDLSDGELLAYLGTDAQRWASEFNWRVLHGGGVDPGILLAWFANAVEAGRDAARARYGLHPAPEVAAEIIGQAVGHASMCWTNPAGAGEFDSAQASEVVVGLLRDLGFDPPEGPVRAADPRNGTERPEDALRRYAEQLGRLEDWFREHPEVPQRSVGEEGPLVAMVDTVIELLNQGLAFAASPAACRLGQEMRDLGLTQPLPPVAAGEDFPSFNPAPLEAGERTEDAERSDPEVTDR